jgi:hypothetical protein
MCIDNIPKVGSEKCTLKNMVAFLSTFSNISSSLENELKSSFLQKET